MVLGRDESSWALRRVQEMVCILEAEYTRPSVIFKPSLKQNLKGEFVAVYFGDPTAFGDTPDQAMRNFDTFWTGKTSMRGVKLPTKGKHATNTNREQT